MKALLAFLIEAACFAGLVYFYIQNRKKEQARREREEARLAEKREDESLE